MSIFDELGHEGPAGTKLFADRYELSREFAERVHARPPQRSIAFFVGVGGNGKSALLRHLRDHCCVKLPDREWAEARARPPELFVAALGQAHGAERVPVALLDFSTTPFDGTRPQEAMGALFLLKRQLAEFDIRTPRFDFAAVAYLHKSGGDVQRLIQDNFPRSELAVAATIADAFLTLPVFQVGTALVEVMRDRLDDLLSRRRLRRRVPPEVVEEVLRLPPDPDLMAALPRLFAADMRAALTERGGPDRIVLLFDTFEALTGEHGVARFADRGGPRWFRQLVGRLPLDHGLVVAIASRSHPRWAEALTDPIPDRFVNVTALGALPVEFAEEYLTQAGIAAGDLRGALIRYATVEPGHVHPLLLGLSADVALAAERRGVPLRPEGFVASDELGTKERELAARLMQWVSGDLELAIVSASAARAFDRELFDRLGAALGFPTDAETFQRLTNFSFVSPQGERYTIHLLLRRALRRVAPDILARAHRALADYYRTVSQADGFSARLERIYHEARLDPAEGVRMWREEMCTALDQSRYDRCRSLITLMADIEAPTEADAEAMTYLAAEAEIALGNHGEAERLLDGLRADAPYALLLRADLAFARSDFGGAHELSRQALAEAGDGDERLPFLFRAAELCLFLGRFAEGVRLSEEGLAIVGPDGNANESARWHALIARLSFFGGDVETAKSELELAQRRLDTLPADSWDKSVEAVIRVNEAVVAEAEDRPGDAQRGQAAALRIYREVSDIGGVANATNGMGLAALQMRELDEARTYFTDAARIARDLGDDLLFSKILRGQAEVSVLAGELDEAQHLAEAAIEGFERCRIPYDIAHGQVTLARVRQARGDHTGSMELTDRARRTIQTEGFDSLYVRCPEIRVPDATRVAAAMRAFVAGDALGVPWEGGPPEAVDRDRMFELPAAHGWPQGATSDDTGQMLLVSRLLADTSGRPAAEEFTRRLAAAASEIRGIGPTTRRSLARFAETGELPEPSADPADGATNGAAMRMTPAGWIVPVTDPDLRRSLVRELARGTHPSPLAIGAACVVAAMASWALESADAILPAAVAEAEWLARPEFDDVRRAADGTWTPPPGGVTLDAAQTAAAVTHVIRRSSDLNEALPYAVTLGGDTDTVAAIAGGILGGVAGQSAPSWWDRVTFPEDSEVDTLAEKLAALRRAWYSM
ncbi:ADP-ribosylglycohydrolase family protein [Sphaerisporangium aureirubrum]|uniref:ADP-ribosylglycohydrolase family protein n=1 Tax=Sphaerisporangium aureirubrum TaxID=1544736 RepID=A0ABW1NS30_9ACTN